MPNKLVRKILIILCVLAIAFMAVIFWRRYSPNNKYIDLKDMISGQEIEKDEAYIFLDDKYLDNIKSKIIEGKVYLPYEVVSKFDTRYYFQSSTDELFFTNAKGKLRIKENSKVGKNEEAEFEFDYSPYVKKDGIEYISLEFVNKYSGSKIGYYEAPNRVIIFTDNCFTKKISDGTAIRNLTGEKSYILKKTENDESVVIIKENAVDGWSKVVSQDGYAGYVENSSLKGDKEQVKNITSEEYNYFKIEPNIKMGWHQVGSQDGNVGVTSLEGINHINVISPTWFSIVNNNGDISNISSSEYVAQMHNKNISVWILCDDFNKDVDMNSLFYNEESRKNLIQNLINETKKVGADGINIDFENVTNENSLSYIQFLRELYLATRNEKLIVSTDNYVPMPYNSHYRIDQQNQVVDYFVIMAYDEHTNASQNAGSVSSYEFLNKGIEDTLLKVSANKIIVGIPFYTRLWKTEPKTSVSNNNISSEIVSMKSQDKVIEDLGATVKWDENTKQNTIDLIKAGVTYNMWLEDEKSIGEKIKLINSKNLAGISFWKLGLEKNDIWNIIK